MSKNNMGITKFIDLYKLEEQIRNYGIEEKEFESITMYNYSIKIYINGEQTHPAETGSWTSKRELAEKEMNEILKSYNYTKASAKGEIVVEEHPRVNEVTGEIFVNSLKDKYVNVGEVNINQEILAKYKGSKVKVIVEIIE